MVAVPGVGNGLFHVRREEVLLPMCGALNIMRTWKSETEQSGAYNCQFRMKGSYIGNGL